MCAASRSIHHCDVLVVGGGPAGGHAALAAAARGRSVIVVDKRRQPGEPVQCAEFVPGPLSGPARAADAQVQHVAAMQTTLPSAQIHETSFPGVMVDRGRFDRAVLQEASSRGARVYARCSLVSLDTRFRRALVRKAGRTLELQYRLVIAADGPCSRVARILGLTSLHTLTTRQYTVALSQPASVTRVWLSSQFPGGYAWLFPKGDAANLGVGLDPHYGVHAKAGLDALHAALMEQGEVEGAILARTGGAIPVSGLRRPLVHDRVLFAGDAGGFTNPVSGAGIPAAVRSGTEAGAASAAYLAGDSGALAEYDDEMREEFGPSLDRAMRRRAEWDGLWRSQTPLSDRQARRGWIAFEEYFRD